MTKVSCSPCETKKLRRLILLFGTSKVAMDLVNSSRFRPYRKQPLTSVPSLRSAAAERVARVAPTEFPAR